MSEKKYQVFISSTYEDLKEERKAVEETIVRAGHFPIGMEAFPAADEEQFEFIKTVISRCDYYVLIIAGRYGSLAPDGKSYTQKEYEYAVEIGVPVLVMLREAREELPVNKTEPSPPNRDKLDEFIATVSHGRLRKGWSTIDGLKLAVREALDHAKATKPRPGWIRGDQSSSRETLEKLVAVQDENERLRQALAEAKPKVTALENLAGLEAPITITGTFALPKEHDFGRTTSTFQIVTNLGEIFELIAPHLLLPLFDTSISSLVGQCLWMRRNRGYTKAENFGITDELFQTIKIQLMALNLVDVLVDKSRSGRDALFWSLTEKGNDEMFRRRTIKAE